MFQYSRILRFLSILVLFIIISLISLISSVNAQTSECNIPGTICGWGSGSDGALGNGDSVSANVPTPAANSLTDVVKIAATSTIFNHNFAYALREDGTVWSWGYGADGQLGNGGFIRGSVPSSFVPQQIASLSNIVDIAAGSYLGFGLAVKEDGTVWAWGSGDAGQLGNGQQGNSSWSALPLQVGGISDVIAVAAGNYTSYALRSDGTVWAWGSGGRGELGNGTRGENSEPPYISFTPVQVSLPPNIIAIAANHHNGYALDADGDVWAWGECQVGQLGNDSPCDSPFFVLFPVKVGSLDTIGITAIATAGTDNTIYALGSDGIVRAWGYGYEGRLGDGVLGNDSYYVGTPVEVTNLTNVVRIGAAWGSGFAVKEDGTTWVWGTHRFEHLADGPGGLPTAIPIQIESLTRPSQITGGLTVYALIGDGMQTPEGIYVALGDSYSSGEGAPNPTYLAGTDIEGNTCHRSSAAYPVLLNDGILSGLYEDFTFRACSGAKIRDFFADNEQHANEPMQLSWLNEQTKLVTLTIGGNDIGFEDVMTYCATRFVNMKSCEEKFGKKVEKDIQKIASTDPGQPHSLPFLFSEIKERVPADAKVVVLGYPRLFPDIPPATCFTGAQLFEFFEHADMLWINAVGLSLNETIKVAAENVGFTYVEVYDAFEGHELCTDEPYLNRTLFNKSTTKWSFHPNVAGQERLADIVELEL